MPPQEQPILFLWSFSPWASKVVAYLALRGIPHRRCEQPVTLPRPDLTALGLKYRRIPVLALGRDIYCDTLLILEKLEKLYPVSKEHPSIGARNGTELALEKLLEKWTDVVVFEPAAAVIPSDMELLKDPKFQKDREELWGRPWTKKEQDRLKPAALVNLRENFDFLERVLGDGRTWICGGQEEDGPRLADIHACWIFDWLLQLPGSFPESFFSSYCYPRTYAWRDRYHAAVAAAKARSPKPAELGGHDAVAQILQLGFTDDVQFEKDPLGLEEGQEVELYPIDTGYTHRDVGKLIGLTPSEAVIQAKSEQEQKEVRIHYPRWNVTVSPVGKEGATNQRAVNGH